MKLMKLCYELAHQYTLTLLGLDGIAVSIKGVEVRNLVGSMQELYRVYWKGWHVSCYHQY